MRGTASFPETVSTSTSAPIVGAPTVWPVALKWEKKSGMALLRKGVMPVREAEMLPYLEIYLNKSEAKLLWERFSVCFRIPNQAVGSGEVH